MPPPAPPPSGGPPTAPDSQRVRIHEYALKRLKESRWLQGSAVLAFLSYGAIPYLIYAQSERLSAGLRMADGAVLVLISLASWSLLFWWYPVFARTVQALGEGPRGKAIAQALEILAISCVVIVHVLMVLLVLRQGTTAP